MTVGESESTRKNGVLVLCWLYCSRAARWNKRVENAGDFVEICWF